MRRMLGMVAALVAVSCGDDGFGPAGIQSVSVSAPYTSVAAGQLVQLSATATASRGTVVQNAPLRWSSSAASVASVSGTGLVTALAPGQAVITASAGRVSGSLTLTVTPATGADAVVTMPGFSFVPFSTTVNAGGTVHFQFPSEPHNVIFNRRAGAPADIPTSSNRVVSRTFNLAGTFPYDCNLHPGMSGTVVVR